MAALLARFYANRQRSFLKNNLRSVGVYGCCFRLRSAKSVGGVGKKAPLRGPIKCPVRGIQPPFYGGYPQAAGPVGSFCIFTLYL